MLQTIHKIFNHAGLRKFLLKLRYVAMLAVLVAIVYFAKREWLWPALAVSFVGELIQVWAFASLVKNETLTARGPYVLVRNPMYLGRYLMMLGLILLTGNGWAAAGFSVIYYFYMANRVGREEARLGAQLGAPYANYCASTNRFWPMFGRLADGAVYFFSWSVLIRNNGQWNFLLMFVLYVALVIYILQR
jgi:protein-S-isoprenylcysteine O-methyltransferase Ste14